MPIDFDPSKTALGLLHFQKDICLEGGAMAPAEAEPLARIGAAIAQAAKVRAAARAVGMPVLHSAFGRREDGHFANRFARLSNWAHQIGGCVEGHQGHEFVTELVPDPDEMVTYSGGISAFTSSSFGADIASLGVQTLILGGITTHWVVEGTVREAADRGFDCIVLKDASAAANPESHEGALERLQFIARVSDVAEVCARLSQ
ncbi:MAG: cysteine hydrolase [Rhodobacteraceae bacterium]|nr:cysteine hydrolase [Paracoccaceae bacterium]